jgi:hypothetical protein
VLTVPSVDMTDSQRVCSRSAKPATTSPFSGGFFPIDYVAIDQAGNTSTSTRTVIVESPATTEPAPTP